MFYGDTAAKVTCHDLEMASVGDGRKASEVDATYGRKLFYEARGYSVTDCFSQATDNYSVGGFSLADFRAEIDAGRPVLLNFYGEAGPLNSTGRSVVGVGYDSEFEYDLYSRSLGAQRAPDNLGRNIFGMGLASSGRKYC